LLPQGGNCDRGSVEREAADPSIVPWLYLPALMR
jgi:hypothetical protein